MAQQVNAQTQSVINHLNKQFAYISQKFANAAGIRVAVRSNDLYKIQVDYAYLIKNVLLAPDYILQKHIMNVNDFFRQIEIKTESLLENKK